MSRADERRLPGDVPRWEVPGWQARFGVHAGITGRGDDPVHPFDLGLWTEQPVGQVMGRWRAFGASLEGSHGMVMAHQVHGARVLWHGGPAAGWSIHEGADGHATSTPGLTLLVTVADCIPIYLLAPERRAIALLHAGWRGTAAGILANGLALLKEHTGVPPDEVILHAGVGISGPCYEVGAEVITGVGRTPVGPAPWQLDIREVILEQAVAQGVGEATSSGLCTVRQHADFFSHRASRGADGRMVAYLGLPGA